MRLLKKYLPFLLASGCILLGAVLPGLTIRMQDRQMDRMQDDFELRMENLSLRQETGIEEIMRMVSKDYYGFPYSEIMEQDRDLTGADAGNSAATSYEVITESERNMVMTFDFTVKMTVQDASGSAMEVLSEMEKAGLLTEGDYELLGKAEQIVEPFVLVNEEGSSALVWSCNWGGDTPYCSVYVDDISGKAVQFAVEYTGEEAENGAAFSVLLQRWVAFLEEYYGLEISDARKDYEKSTDNGDQYFLLYFDLKDNQGECVRCLNFYENDRVVSFY